MIEEISSEKKLLDLLKKYYRRVGNKLQIKNGMSLNQLAFAMWDRLGFSQMDPATLSRILSGQRLFTKRQLEVFCDVVDVSESDRQTLTQLLIVSLLKRYHFDEGESIQSAMTNFIHSIPLHIYFTAALVQQEELNQYYQIIVEQIKVMGHRVTEDSTTTPLDTVMAKTKQERIDYYNYIDELISEVDVVAAEVSFPSTLNIGHEITLALGRGKPVVAFYLTGRESYFFEGNVNDFLVHAPYDETNLPSVVRQNMVYAQMLALTSPRLRESIL